MSYNIYDASGRKIGEAHRDYSYELAALLFLLAIGFVIIPHWTLYAVGKGNWQDRRLITRLTCITLTSIWVVGGAGAILGGVRENILAPIVALGIFFSPLAGAYLIGKSLRPQQY
jgi:hypothetical protein